MSLIINNKTIHNAHKLAINGIKDMMTFFIQKCVKIV